MYDILQQIFSDYLLNSELFIEIYIGKCFNKCKNITYRICDV